MLEPLQARIEAGKQNPEQLQQRALDFYGLQVEMDIAAHEEHAKIAGEFGQLMDEAFASEVIIPRLQTGERIHLVVPVALRAAVWLVNSDAQTNIFKQLEQAAPGQFNVTYLPLGVTRHRTNSPEINFYRYYPNGGTDVTSLVDRREDSTLLVRSVDFGGASGVSMAETTKLAMNVLEAEPENTFIDTVISSDHAQGVYAGVVPAENSRRRLAGAVNDQFWIVGSGRSSDSITHFSQLGLSPKDWGFVCTGMEDFREILGTDMSAAELAQFYTATENRFFARLYDMMALNDNRAMLDVLRSGGEAELRAWYSKRFMPA